MLPSIREKMCPWFSSCYCHLIKKAVCQ